MSQLTTVGDLERADTLIAQGRLESAVSLLERIAFANPEDGTVWARLTSALIDCGEHERAAITSYAFEALAPSPAAYLLRSRALLVVDPQEALSSALSAQAASPGDWRTHAQVARCLIAGPDSNGRGLAAAQKAASMSPEEAEAHVVLAQALRRHNQLKAAEAAAGKAMSLDPRNADARDLLQGLALLTPEAAISARQATARRSGHNLILLVLTVVLVAAIAVPVVLVKVGAHALYAAAVSVALLMLALAFGVRGPQRRLNGICLLTAALEYLTAAAGSRMRPPGTYTTRGRDEGAIREG